MSDPFCELPVALPTDNEARKIIEGYRSIAVVGLSSRADKPSHFVPRFLKDQGYRIIPVNPNYNKPILGERVFPNLEAIGEPVDIVNIFRPSAEVPGIVEAAIATGAKVIWMQEGIVHHEAAKRALEAGLKVVMGKCMMKVLKSG